MSKSLDIKYDYASSTLCSSDQPKGCDATIYITVTDNTVTEREVIIAYWKRDKEIGGTRSASSVLGTKTQCLDDTDAVGVGEYLGVVYACTV
jgi:hypothetical protein